jgi:hypothetical protein
MMMVIWLCRSIDLDSIKPYIGFTNRLFMNFTILIGGLSSPRIVSCIVSLTLHAVDFKMKTTNCSSGFLAPVIGILLYLAMCKRLENYNRFLFFQLQ